MTAEVQPAAPFGLWERTLAARYLRTKRKNGGVAVISIISFIGVMLAVAVLIIVMSVMNGFRSELLARTLGFNGHLYVTGAALDPGERDAVIARLRAIPGVVQVSAMVEAEALVQGRGQTAGGIVRGLSPADLHASKFIAGNIKHGGLVEKAFGITLRELVEDFGGGTASGRPVKAIQVGGPLGAYVPPEHWDLPLDYETYAAVGAVVGHGGIVVHDDTADLSKLARYAMEFCAIESCGKCTPCRIGSTRGVEVIDRIVATNADPQIRPQQVKLLRDLCDTMLHGSLCAMGNMTPYPVLSALNHYPQDFGLAAPAAKAA